MKITPKIKLLVENNPIALATVDGRGNPHVIAVACVKVVDGKLIITDNCLHRTRANILANGKASIAAWNPQWQGVKLSGKAEYHAAGKWKAFVKTLPENKGLPAKGAVVFTPRTIS